MKTTILYLAIGALTSLYVRWKGDKDITVWATADEIRSLPPEALYPALKGDKWGYINARKEWVIPPVYHEATEFVADRAVVELRPPPSMTSDNRPRLGQIDKTGKQIVPCIYQCLEYIQDGLACAKKDEQWGFIDRQGHVVVPFRYEEAGPFSEGLACLTVDGRNGFIDKQGRMVIAPRFKRMAYYFRFLEGYTQVYGSEGNDKELGAYIDKAGQYVIRPQFAFADPFLEGLAVAQPLHLPYFGFIDKQGKWAIPPTKYQNALGFSEGLSSVAILTPDKKKWQWSVIDKSGKVVLADLPYRMIGAFVGGLAPVQSETSRNWGFIDPQGREVIPTIYSGLNRGLKIVYLTKAGHVFWQQD